MSDPLCLLADCRNWRHRGYRFHRQDVFPGGIGDIPFGDREACDVRWQIGIWIANRLAGDELHPQNRIVPSREALRQDTVCIEVDFGLGQHVGDILRGTFIHRDVGQHTAQPADPGQSRVNLGLRIKDRVPDRLGTASHQLVGHLGVDFARPRPAADILDAFIVDFDHGYLVARIGRGHPHTQVIGIAFEAAEHGVTRKPQR